MAIDIAEFMQKLYQLFVAIITAYIIYLILRAMWPVFVESGMLEILYNEGRTIFLWILFALILAYWWEQAS